jgi:hypothetical protein
VRTKSVQAHMETFSPASDWEIFALCCATKTQKHSVASAAAAGPLASDACACAAATARAAAAAAAATPAGFASKCGPHIFPHFSAFSSRCRGSCGVVTPIVVVAAVTAEAAVAAAAAAAAPATTAAGVLVIVDSISADSAVKQQQSIGAGFIPPVLGGILRARTCLESGKCAKKNSSLETSLLAL